MQAAFVSPVITSKYLPIFIYRLDTLCVVTVELETIKSALGWSKGTICSTVISQKGICEQGHNLHYKEYVFPRKHASVSHFVVIGLQICCSGFFPWSDQKRIGLISGDMPWNHSKPILKQVRSLNIASCCSGSLPVICRAEKMMNRSFSNCSPGFMMVCVCVYQIPNQTFMYVSGRKKNKNKKNRPIHIWALLNTEWADALIYLFRWVELQFMTCGWRSMLNNLFLNSFTTQPAGHWNQNDFWRQLWLWSTTNKCYQTTGEQRIAHRIMFFDWGPLS